MFPWYILYAYTEEVKNRFALKVAFVFLICFKSIKISKLLSGENSSDTSSWPFNKMHKNICFQMFNLKVKWKDLICSCACQTWSNCEAKISSYLEKILHSWGKIVKKRNKNIQPLKKNKRNADI